MTGSMKSYILFAGVNGAGKTTLFNTNHLYAGMIRINLDETVRSFGSWKNSGDVLKAGLICVKRIRDCLQQGISFNQETTLCGRSIIKQIRKAKECGFRVELYYVGVESPEIAKERVRDRVKQGGHGIPGEDIERRYYESLKNLPIVLKFCDKATIYDNSEEFKKLAEYDEGNCMWLSEKPPEWFCKIMLPK